MKTVTWMVTRHPTNFNKTFNAKGMFGVDKRLQRYWNVRLVQVTSRAELTINLATRNSGTALAWYGSNIINIPLSYNFRGDLITCEFVLTHEIGHHFGGLSHAPQGPHIMSPVAVSPYNNFTTVDMKWFPLQFKSNLRPWQEPDYFRPLPSEQLLFGEPLDFRHKESIMTRLYDRLMSRFQKPVFIEEN